MLVVDRLTSQSSVSGGCGCTDLHRPCLAAGACMHKCVPLWALCHILWLLLGSQGLLKVCADDTAPSDSVCPALLWAATAGRTSTVRCPGGCASTTAKGGTPAVAIPPSPCALCCAQQRFVSTRLSVGSAASGKVALGVPLPDCLGPGAVAVGWLWLAGGMAPCLRWSFQGCNVPGVRHAAVALSLQSFLCSSSTLGCLRAWQFPLHFLVSDPAYPRCLLCPLPHRLVGQS